MKKRIVFIRGDGSGPEIMNEGLKVLRAIEKKYGHEFKLVEAFAGAGSYLKTGECFPEKTKRLILSSDCVIKAPVGLSLEDMSSIPLEHRPEMGFILPIRKMLDTYLCLRPVRLPRKLAWFSPLKPEIIGDGIDILMVRELVGGIYFGDKVEASEENDFMFASDDCEYTDEQVRRVAIYGFEEAKKLGVKMTSVHKKNVLATSRLWDRVVEDVRQDYLDVPYESVLVDNLAYQIVINPTQYNGVVIMENFMGDVITDEAGGVLGSLGLMPSACINPDGISYVEPSHGSAPDIAGKNKVNPYAMIGSVALMFEKCFELPAEAKEIWDAMFHIFSERFVTAELAPEGYDSEKILSTSAFGDMVVEIIDNTPVIE